MVFRVILLALCLAGPARADGPLVVFAAASLGGPLDAAAQAFGGEVTISYAGSPVLARHVAAGAPADVVVLANAAWMDWLVAEGAVIAPPRVLFGNRLVLASRDPLAPDLAAALSALPVEARLATGLVEAVPVGIYTADTLRALGIYDAMLPRLVQAENARVAVALAARGDVAAVFAYATDAVAEPRLAHIVPVPSDLHDPIVYPAAVAARSDHPRADAFLEHLGASEALALFVAAGFTPPAP